MKIKSEIYKPRNATDFQQTTSSDGSYTLRLKDPAEAIIFSYVGMEPTRKVIGSDTQINVTLGSVNNQLDEVEVVSTGYQKIAKDWQVRQAEEAFCQGLSTSPGIWGFDITSVSTSGSAKWAAVKDTL